MVNTFFYMPSREHWNVRAGFAFVNFISPMDVLVLDAEASTGLEDACGNPPTKLFTVSYSRFQGHEALEVIFKPEMDNQCSSESRPCQASKSLDDFACRDECWTRQKSSLSTGPLLQDDDAGLMRQQSAASSAATCLNDDADAFRRQESSTSASSSSAAGPALEAQPPRPARAACSFPWGLVGSYMPSASRG
ncbi:unnamed protein product [Prorocentrum cordatum]|uniref:Uncharacterized protein n=1 Tax=Prorocentrum cordatum TaxID=2364126 RepID=A0ABN9Y8C3_9DINO|nr:unnamed protein product [Polarella glacialis]